MNNNDLRWLHETWRGLKMRGLTTLEFADYVKAQQKEPKMGDILYAAHARKFQGFDDAKHVACTVLAGAPKRAA